MVKFIYKFDLRKELKMQWHKAKVSNLKIRSKFEITSKEVFEKGEIF